MLKFVCRKKYPDTQIDISFDSSSTLITGLFGRSGSGKTSVINMIAGLTEPDEGVIEAAGRTLYDKSRNINIPAPMRRIGYIFQEGRLFPHMSVEKNLRYGSTRKNKGSLNADYGEIVSLLGLENHLSRKPHKLSGGEKQRVAIGRALLSSPDILLMDEPLAALDTARKNELLPFIAKTVQKFRIPTVYVTHSVDELLMLCENAVLLENGHTADRGSVADVVSSGENTGILGLSGRVSVLNAKTVKSEKQAMLTMSDGTVLLPTDKYKEGTTVRLSIHADDVTLAVSRPEGLSSRNIIQGTATEISETGDGGVCVTVDAGVKIYATVTKSAARELNIVRGCKVYAVLKTIALTRMSLPYLNINE